MKLTPRATRVLNIAAEVARELNCEYIGTEALLVALIRENHGVTGVVLQQQEVTEEKVIGCLRPAIDF